MSEVLALETYEGDINICYASPDVTVHVTGAGAMAYDKEGRTVEVELYNEISLRETGTFQDFWEYIHQRRNTDVRLRLIGG